jgi:hypothetical protein
MRDKDQRALKGNKLLQIIDALVDSPDQLHDDELDELYRQIKPDEDPKQWMRAAAAKAAQLYRLRGVKVPYHVQESLEATKPASIEDSSPSGLMRLIDSLLSPADPSRRLQPVGVNSRQTPDMELSEKDREILAGLSDAISNPRDEKEEENP